MKYFYTILFVFLGCWIFPLSASAQIDKSEDLDIYSIEEIPPEIEPIETYEFEIPKSETLEGKIIEVLENKEISFGDQTQKYQKLKIFVTNGSFQGQEIVVENGSTLLAQVIEYKKGDKVQIEYTKDFEDNDIFYITDFIRTPGITVLFIVFVILSLLIGSKKGFFSIISMFLSFVILFAFVLPQIQAGHNPVVIAIIASIGIIPITFYLSHGFNKKVTVSILGTLVALILTGILSVIFVNLTHLTGTADEETLFLQTFGDIQYNLKGLLLSGIIIGTLGVLDDITVSQTSIVYQLHELKKDISFSELFSKSIKIGKDHIASMINTLILVYTGASLPLLILFMNDPRPIDQLISLEPIATEIVRTLVGSIGLILAVPITTYLACISAKKTQSST